MKYVIGIDGGGTKTKFTVVDMDGNIIGNLTSGPCNLCSIDVGYIRNMLKESLNEILLINNLAKEDCKGICLGAAGAAREKDQNILLEIINSIGFKNNIYVTNDAVISLFSFLKEDEGMVLISGTGSMALGSDYKGELVRVGGWGHLIDDVGSGYYIGREILSSIMKAFDGRENETILKELVLDYLNLNKEEDLISYIYKNFTKDKISELSILINKGIEANDSVSIKILSNTVYELYSLIKICYERIYHNKSLKLALNGGVIEKNSYIKDGVLNLIRENKLDIEIVDKKVEAALGAIYLLNKIYELKISVKDI